MIEWIISSSILIVVIIALRYILRGKISLRLQYALWGLVLLRLLLPFSVGSSGISVANVLPDNIPERILSAGIPDSAHTAPKDGTPEPPVPAVPDAPSGVPAQSGTETVFQDNAPDVSVKVTDWGVIATTVWLTGAAVVGLWLLISNLRLAGKLKKSRQALACQSRGLPVYLSDGVDAPCLFGLFRPSIYVTAEAAECETRLRHILAHETTHFRHGDHIWSVLRGVCLALHWYNPLVWWAAILSRNDSELSCDEGTIKRIGEQERAEYGRTLIAMTCRKRPALLIAATTMTGGKSSIRERITLIARKPKTAVCTLIAVAVIAAVAVGCTFTGAKEAGGSADGDHTLYDCDGLTVAVPNEYIDQLIVHMGDGQTPALIAFYEKASIEDAAADGIDADTINDSGLGWLFSLIRYDQAQYEQYLRADRSGRSFFAKDDAWYYGYATATDAQFYHGDEEALARWNALTEQMGQSIRDDFIERNGLTPFSDIAAEADSSADGDYTLYDCDGLTVAVPNEYIDQLIVRTGEELENAAALISVYEKASVEAAAADGLDDPIRGGLGWLFSLLRYDQEQYEQYLNGSHDGRSVFAQDGEWYYCYATATDARFYFGGGKLPIEEALAQWEMLNDQVCPSIRDDFIERNGLTPFSDTAADPEAALWRDGYPYPAGPGSEVSFHNEAYDGPETVEVLEGWEPVYQDGDYWARHSWEGFEADCYHSAGGGYSVFRIDTTRTDLFTKRGVRVGDSRETVLAAYPELKSGDYWGQYPGEDYLWYCDSPEDFGAALLFFFEGDKVSRIVLNNMFD